MGCVDRLPRRKYHSVLTVRHSASGELLHLLTDFAEKITVGANIYLLHNFNFAVDVFPQGFQHLVSFSHFPAPFWRYNLGGLKVERSLELDPEQEIVRIAYHFSGVTEPTQFTIEPLVTCRPAHRLSRENPFLNGAARAEGGSISIEPYSDLPKLFLKMEGPGSTFQSAGRWDRGIHYPVEQERGYEAFEDLYCPGSFRVELKTDGVVVFHAGTISLEKSAHSRTQKAREPAPAQVLASAADQFLATKPDGTRSIIAGYPWYGELGRDAMVSLPGLCLATGKVSEASVILSNYGSQLMKGSVQGWPDSVEQTQNGMVDTALFYIRAVQLLGKYAGPKTIKPLMPIVYSILNNFRSGRDDRVRVTSDGGLFIKPNPCPMTWMGVQLDGQPLTPRFGFAVEQNGLFYNAAHFALDWAVANQHSDFIRDWSPILEDAETAFMSRFWTADFGYLCDAFDGSAQDMSLRPNQLWAVGLPYSPVPATAAREIVEKIRQQLLTPVGLRTLAPSDPRYQGRYRGSPMERELALHQGTVAPWLIGIYADTLVKLYGTERARTELTPILNRLITHMNAEACLGQISEVFDGDEPHRAEGCPAQAWSVAEVLRVMALVKQE